MRLAGCGANGAEGHGGTNQGGDAAGGRAKRNCAPVVGMRSNPTYQVVVRALLALAVLLAPLLALLYSVPAGLVVMAIALFMLAHVLFGTRAILEPRARQLITALVWLNVALGAACLAAAGWLLASGG